MRRKVLAKAPITEERWTVECEESFRSVKQGLASHVHVELAFPDDDEVLLVSTDVSLHTWAGVVTQVSREELESMEPGRYDKLSHRLLFAASGAFVKSAMHWSVSCKEAFALVATRRKAAHILDRHPLPVRLLTDSNILRYVLSSTTGKTASDERLTRWAQEISTLEYVVEHVPSERNALADLLTRFTPTTAGVSVAAVTRSAATKRAAMAPTAGAGAPPTGGAVRKRQRRALGTAADVGGEEPLMTHVAAATLENGSEVPTLGEVLVAQKEHIDDDGVDRSASDSCPFRSSFKLEQDSDGVWRREGALYVPVAARHLRLRFIVAAHQGAAGHGGGRATVELLKRAAWWPGARKDARQFVASCLFCQPKGGRVSRSRGTVPHGTGPFTVLHADYVQMPEAKDGSRHVLVLTDDFSGLVQLSAVSSASAASTVAGLEAWTGQRGRLGPLFVSDAGSHFTAEEVKDYLGAHGVRHHVSTPYNSKSSGTVEVVNSHMLQTMRAMKMESQVVDDEWPVLLKRVEAALNLRPRERLGNLSPVEVCYREVPGSTAGAAGDTRQPVTRTTRPSAPEVLRRVDQLAEAFEGVRERVREASRRSGAPRGTGGTGVDDGTVWWSARDRDDKDVLQVGWVVMVSRDDRRNKLHSKWQGPYVITKRDADRKRVDVRHVVDHSELKNIHDDRVKEYSQKMVRLPRTLAKAVAVEKAYEYKPSDFHKVVGHGEQDGQLWLHCEINQGRGKPKLNERVDAETVVRLRLKLVQRYLRVQSRHGGDSELDLLQTLVDSVASTRGAAGH